MKKETPRIKFYGDMLEIDITQLDYQDVKEITLLEENRVQDFYNNYLRFYNSPAILWETILDILNINNNFLVEDCRLPTLT